MKNFQKTASIILSFMMLISMMAGFAGNFSAAASLLEGEDIVNSEIPDDLDTQDESSEYPEDEAGNKDESGQPE